MPGTPGRSGGHNRKENPQRGTAAETLARLRHGGSQADLEPTASGSLEKPERPAWIGADLVAVEAFDRIVELLHERETVTLADRDAILLAALAESEYRAAAALIASEGLIVDGKPHPATKLAESSWKRWSAALSRLGLDPITRPRVLPARKKPSGKFNRFRSTSAEGPA